MTALTRRGLLGMLFAAPVAAALRPPVDPLAGMSAALEPLLAPPATSFVAPGLTVEKLRRAKAALLAARIEEPVAIVIPWPPGLKGPLFLGEWRDIPVS
jgi:hypothetical protein